MKDLIKFTQAYIECALWASVDNDGNPLDKNYSQKDIAAKTLERMQQDCARFQETYKTLLEESGLSESKSGHNFWLSRNSHGSGFFEEGLGDTGDELQEASKSYGMFDLYVGDDALIHGS